MPKNPYANTTLTKTLGKARAVKGKDITLDESDDAGWATESDEEFTVPFFEGPTKVCHLVASHDCRLPPGQDIMPFCGYCRDFPGPTVIICTVCHRHICRAETLGESGCAFLPGDLTVDKFICVVCCRKASKPIQVSFNGGKACVDKLTERVLVHSRRIWQDGDLCKDAAANPRHWARVDHAQIHCAGVEPASSHNDD